MAEPAIDPRVDENQSISFEGLVVKVLVDGKEPGFYVHDSLLCAHSQFFQAALRHQWKESKDRQIDLPDDCSEVFHKYVQWLYTGNIYIQVATSPEDAKSKNAVVRLARLYAFAVKILDEAFQDCVINSIVAITREDWGTEKIFYTPNEEIVNIFYEHTPMGSKGRQLMVNLWSIYGCAEWITNSDPPLDHEFLADLSSVFFEEKLMVHKELLPQYAQLEAGWPCFYHAHPPDKPCGKKQK